MCLAVPGKILSISGDDPLTRTGRVSFGGIIKEVTKKRKFKIGEPIKDGDASGKVVFATPRSFFVIKKALDKDGKESARCH